GRRRILGFLCDSDPVLVARLAAALGRAAPDTRRASDIRENGARRRQPESRRTSTAAIVRKPPFRGHLSPEPRASWRGNGRALLAFASTPQSSRRARR